MQYIYIVFFLLRIYHRIIVYFKKDERQRVKRNVVQTFDQTEF